MMRSTGFSRSALLLLVALTLALPGCKTVGGWLGKKSEDKTESLPVEQMYSNGHEQLLDGDYSDANRYFTRLIARFPFGPYAEQAQLEQAYALLKMGKREDASSAIDRFIRTYPRHAHIDYAYYLKAVINFDRNVSFFTRVFRTDVSARDLNGPTQSYNDFAEVISRYPNSVYAQDSRQRMIYLRNQLARHERNVAMYYWRRGAYVAAVNRAKFLLENYPQSEYQADAVALMAASYTALGQKQLADDAAAVLKLNDPQHPYLAGEWPEKRGMLRRLNPFKGELK
jgi:outer membrane protein assembly factor BamD